MQTKIRKIYNNKSILIRDNTGHAISFLSQTLSRIVFNLKILGASSTSRALHSFLRLK